MPLFFKPKASREASKNVPTAPPAADSPGSADPGSPIAPVDPALEGRIVEIGTEFLDRSRGGKAGVLSKVFWSDKLMDWSMKDEDFKVQLFRFVDAFPMLKTPDQVHDHLVDI